jgi:hypothetical protein
VRREVYRLEGEVSGCAADDTASGGDFRMPQMRDLDPVPCGGRCTDTGDRAIAVCEGLSYQDNDVAQIY